MSEINYDLGKVFQSVFPKANPKYANIITGILKNENLYNLKSICAFLSQCGHESQYFTRTEENLNYSASSLLAVFPKYFNKDNVDDYARKPEKIANRVYANRMGNGDESSGDGYKYRGRGILQITGKYNYQLCSNEDSRLKNCLENPDMLKEPDYAVASAIWFWKKNNLDSLAQLGDIKGLTKKINGGYNGLNDRTELYNKIYTILSESN